MLRQVVVYRTLLSAYEVQQRCRLSSITWPTSKAYVKHHFSVRSSIPTTTSKKLYSTLARRSSLMAQFHHIKQQYKNYILLFQVGDFYEMYSDDASVVASKTSLRLTTKQNVFMCGFPVKSLSEWQKILIQSGFQLAICNQEPPVKGRKNQLLGRGVVKLVTPGTLIEPLHDEANYLLSIATGRSSTIGLAWADISTSEFKVSSSEMELLDDDLERITPSEVLLTDAIVDAVQEGRILQPTHPDHVTVMGLTKSSLLKECHLTGVPAMWYTNEEEESERTRYQDTELNLFSQLEQAASRALLRFIGHTQKSVVPHLSPPSLFCQGHHMTIDSNTRRALELVVPLHSNTRKATLLGSIDRTVTAPGKRLIKARLISPLTEEAEIMRRLDAVQVFKDDVFSSEVVMEMLKGCEDLERILQKVSTGVCTITDLLAIKTTLQLTGKILDFIRTNFSEDKCRYLKDEMSGLCSFIDLIRILDSAISGDVHGNYIAKGYSSEVDTFRSKIDKNHEQANLLVEQLRSELSISRLTVVAHKSYLRVLEVPKSQTSKTEKSSDLISHLDLQRLNAELSRLESSYSTQQEQLFKDLCNKVMSNAVDIQKTSQSLAKLDVAISLGLLAAERGYSKPVIIDGSGFRVVGGVHPVVASQQLTTFVRNNCILDAQKQWIVTGPNMGGKSTFLRQNGLLTILSQMGSFVPAESATLGVIDRLFARVGASDNVSKHMSTFHLEMSETAHILTNATSRSFVIMDEIGRGTAYSEGLAIAEAVVEYIHRRIGCKLLLATHYHELASFGETLESVACFKLTAKTTNDDGIIFTYQVEPGCAKHSYALDVAKISGLPMEVIQRAKFFQDDMSQVEHLGNCVPTKQFDDVILENSQGRDVLRKIEEISLDHTTPLEAMNFLHHIKKTMS